MPEFTYSEPCGKPVTDHNDKLLGFCTRRIDHEGGCTNLVDDRTTHNLREHDK